MKKILTAGVALLSVATLAACSGKTASNSSSKDAKASSSKVEKSSTSTSKSKSSSKSSKTSVDIPEIVLLTDEEIDNAKTIGDMKSLYNKLVDNYKKICSRSWRKNSGIISIRLYQSSRSSSQDTGRIKNSI